MTEGLPAKARRPACHRCGAPLLTLVELAAIALRVDSQLSCLVADRVDVGARAEVRLLASALLCLAGTCRASSENRTPPTWGTRVST